METKDYIYKRKSTRKYEMEALEPDVLEGIEAFSKTLKPLDPLIRVEYEFVRDVKNILPVKAPHYIIISSEQKEGYLTNVGFMFQQMDLYLSSIGLGSCWLGMARPREKEESNLEFVIILAFGKAEGSPYRELSGFKRKPLGEISQNGDERLEVVRLAPSATNSQPWYFISKGDVIDVYGVKLGLVKAVLYEKMNKIDMGIALAHLYVANKESFEFYREDRVEDMKGYSYVGSVKI